MQRESENKYSVLKIIKVIGPHMEIFKHVFSDYYIQPCLKNENLGK